MKVMIVADYYLPGTRAGGPVQSIKHLIDQFGRQHEMLVVTRDRDVGDEQPYTVADSGELVKIDSAMVRYLQPTELIRRSFQREIEAFSPDLLYLNSLFSVMSRNALEASRGNASVRKLLAVRGELDPGALSIKPYKKKLFLWFSRLFRKYGDVEFQASSPDEKRFIQKHFPNQRVHIACNIPGSQIGTERAKMKRPSRLVFASRVSPKKNLETALRAFSELLEEDRETFDEFCIYGDCNEPSYLDQITSIIDGCGGRATYCGPYDHNEITEILNEASYSILPTLGENFGHSIYESAAAGIPFLISDRTPWTEAANDGAGWALPPNDIVAWKKALVQCLSLDDGDYRRRSSRAIYWAKKFQATSLEEHSHLFESLSSAQR